VKRDYQEDYITNLSMLSCIYQKHLLYTVSMVTHTSTEETLHIMRINI